jgi:hypothetical protein
LVRRTTALDQTQAGWTSPLGWRCSQLVMLNSDWL